MTTDNTTLSIRLLPGGFSFSGKTYDVASGADYDKRLIEALLDAGIAEVEPNGPVVCLVDTNRISLSPASIEADLAEEMFHLTHQPAEGEEILLRQTDDTLGISLLFGISSQVYHFLLRTYQEVEFLHPLFLEHLEWNRKLQQETPEGNCMVAFADDRHLGFLIYRDGKLQTLNSVESTSEGNLIYFLLNAWSQNHLDFLADTLYLQTDSEHFRETVSTYIKKCV